MSGHSAPEALLEQAQEAARQSDLVAALYLCAEAASSGADPADVARTQAFAQEMAKSYREARDLWASLSGGDQAEPNDLYRLALMHLALGDWQAADAAATQAMARGEETGFTYYSEACRLVRAFALVKLGRNAEALADLEHITDTARDFIPNHGLIQAADLRRQAGQRRVA